MAKYFRDLWRGIRTVLEGMWVTFAHLFQKRITVQYPKETVPMFDRTRAMLVNDAEICGYCLACKRVCPANIFTIVGARAEAGEDLGILPDGKPKKMHILEFKIDMSKCMYCGLCVVACDTHSLHWKVPQEPPVLNRRDLHMEFSDMSEELKRTVRDREEAKKKAKAAEAAAKAAAPKPAEPDTKPAAENGGNAESAS